MQSNRSTGSIPSIMNLTLAAALIAAPAWAGDPLADGFRDPPASARPQGMTYYTEVQGDTPRSISDGMTAKAQSDVPTGEFWYRPFATDPGQPSLVADLQLQQGRFVADIDYFNGEEKNLTQLFEHRQNTDIPAGYGFDYTNLEALLIRLSIRNGRIVTDSGMKYRMLYVPPHVTHMTLAAATTISTTISFT